jgi:hypothetical protein
MVQRLACGIHSRTKLQQPMTESTRKGMAIVMVIVMMIVIGIEREREREGLGEGHGMREGERDRLVVAE